MRSFIRPTIDVNTTCLEDVSTATLWPCATNFPFNTPPWSISCRFHKFIDNQRSSVGYSYIILVRRLVKQPVHGQNLSTASWSIFLLGSSLSRRSQGRQLFKFELEVMNTSELLVIFRHSRPLPRCLSFDFACCLLTASLPRATMYSIVSRSLKPFPLLRIDLRLLLWLVSHGIRSCQKELQFPKFCYLKVNSISTKFEFVTYPDFRSLSSFCSWKAG